MSGNTECGTADETIGHHAVRLEKAAHDAGFDVGVRAEDDDEFGQRLPDYPITRLLDSDSSSLPDRDRHRSRADTWSTARSTFRRIIVMSSCWGAPLTNSAISRSTRSRSVGQRRSHAFSTSLAEAGLAKTVVARIHALPRCRSVKKTSRSPVVKRNRLLLEDALEHLPVVDLQSEHETVRSEDARESLGHQGQPVRRSAAYARLARRSSCGHARRSPRRSS